MHRVAFKIGLFVACAAGIFGWLVAEIGVAPWVYGALAAIVAGAAAYAVAARLLGRRLNHVASVLDHLLADGGRVSAVQGDEVDLLLRRSDQAMHAVRKQIADLNRTEKYRREYVGDVSHEIKTPIFAIYGFAETLLSGAIDDPSVRRNFVEKILHHANRLNALVRDLSDISRLETGALKLSTAPFTTASMFQEIRDSLEVAARVKVIDVRIDVGVGAGAVEGDRERIIQVMTNLVDNAITYTNSGGWVMVRAEKEASEIVRLSVHDNGIGIEPEEIGRITERFYRTEKSRSRNQGGTGLGLSIVKHILAAHGTTLHIESEVGRGSVFSFNLPVATSPGLGE